MLPANARLWALLNTASQQWHTRVVSVATPTRDGSIIPTVQSRLQGLDLRTLASLAPAFGIEVNQFLFEKVHAFETECLRIWQGGYDECTEKKKEGCRLQFGKHLDWACRKCPEGSVKEKTEVMRR